jgi:ketosteroid isomerase-like protein
VAQAAAPGAGGQSASPPEEVVQQFYVAFNEGQLADLDGLLPDNFSWHMPGADDESLAGREGHKLFASLSRRAFRDLRIEAAPEDMIVAGQRVVAPWRATGTHTGSVPGIAPTGKRVTVEGIDIWTVDGDQLLALRRHWDQLELLRQLYTGQHDEAVLFKNGAVVALGEQARTDTVELYKLHQQTLWSRIQTAAVIEAAAVGGWYTLWISTLPDAPRRLLQILVLVGGALLLFALTLLVLRDGQHITACEHRAGDWLARPEVIPPMGVAGGRSLAFAVLIALAIGDLAFAVWLGRRFVSWLDWLPGIIRFLPALGAAGLTALALIRPLRFVRRRQRWTLHSRAVSALLGLCAAAWFGVSIGLLLRSAPGEAGYWALLGLIIMRIVWVTEERVAKKHPRAPQ